MKDKNKKNENRSKMDKEVNVGKTGEDTTMYGEFVCTNFHWILPEEQKKKAKDMENITNKEHE